MVKGSCLCGDVAWEVEGDLVHMTHCHCSMCRKHHGSMYATYVGVPTAGFRWVSGEDKRNYYESSRDFTRAFCPGCGSVVPTPDRNRAVSYVPAGNFAGDCGTRPEAHIFATATPEWYPVTDDLPRFDGYPPGYDAAPVERPAPPAAREGVAAGSCLCGTVTFEYDGAPETMRNCHCSRCRRSKSAAHATNVFVKAENFRWVTGADEVVIYKLPEAERFGHAFCRRCGSSMPRAAPGAPMVNVPAGALDTDPGMRPVGHIFVGSMAPWHLITDDLPQHPEMSPG